VDYEGQSATVSLIFYAAGITTLADEILTHQQEPLPREQRA